MRTTVKAKALLSGARVTKTPQKLYRSDLEDDRPHKIISDKKKKKKIHSIVENWLRFEKLAVLPFKAKRLRSGSESELSATFGSSPLFLLIWFYFIVESLKLAASS